MVTFDDALTFSAHAKDPVQHALDVCPWNRKDAFRAWLMWLAVPARYSHKTADSLAVWRAIFERSDHYVETFAYLLKQRAQLALDPSAVDPDLCDLDTSPRRAQVDLATAEMFRALALRVSLLEKP